MVYGWTQLASRKWPVCPTYFDIEPAAPVPGSEQTGGHTGRTMQHMQGQLQVWGVEVVWNPLDTSRSIHTDWGMR